MQTVHTTIADSRGKARLAVRAAMIAGFAALVCGCNTDQQITGVPDVPTDYRMRHPITMTEGDHTLQVFMGSNRGTLTATQRAEVLAFAQSWRQEATGGVIIDLPRGSSNARSSADALHEIQSILVASGVPPHGIVVRNYAAVPGNMPTIRITYPRIIAQAGPCGLWPQDTGPSMYRDYFENQPPWNFGCSTQHNLAAMVDNPADLVEPRGDTPVYAMRRNTVIEDYRRGVSSSTQSSTTSSGKIANVGQ
jgi:pilus assembly protein CpaD